MSEVRFRESYRIFRRVNELEHSNLKDFGMKMFSVLASTRISNKLSL